MYVYGFSPPRDQFYTLYGVPARYFPFWLLLPSFLWVFPLKKIFFFWRLTSLFLISVFFLIIFKYGSRYCPIFSSMLAYVHTLLFFYYSLSYGSIFLALLSTLPSGKMTSISLRYYIFYIQYISISSFLLPIQPVAWTAIKSSFGSFQSHQNVCSVPGCWDYGLCETCQCGALNFYF